MTTTTDEWVDALAALLTASGLTVPAPALAAFRAKSADWAYIPAAASRLVQFISDQGAVLSTPADGGPNGDGVVYITDPATGAKIPRDSYYKLKAGMAKGDPGVTEFGSFVENGLVSNGLLLQYLALAPRSLSRVGAVADSPSTTTVTIPIKKNGAAAGSIVFSPGVARAVCTLTPGLLTLALNDVLTVRGPAMVDASLGNITLIFGA